MKIKKNKQPKELSAKARARQRSELAGSRVKLRFKKHFVPPLVGLCVTLLFFGFFDSELLSSHIAYYRDSKRPQAVTNASTLAVSVAKNSAPRLVLNNINLNAPVIFENDNSPVAFQKDLQNGIVHYPGSALPGQEGNVVIFGRASSQWWAKGQYNFALVALNRVVIGDKIFLDYLGNRYIYNVYNITLVSPSDLSVLNQSSNYTLTLMTTAPLGGQSERLIIIAQQYSPAVANDYASTRAATLPPGADGTLPGSESSFWHDLGERISSL